MTALTDPETPSGVPHGGTLLRFAEALVEHDAAGVVSARAALIVAMGDAAAGDAAGVASNFERMVRIADSTGIELGDVLESASADVRAELGLTRA